MSPNRPYLIRAVYEWLVDNDTTPYLMVNAEYEGAEVPRQFVDDGRIILNVDPSAVSELEMGNEWISFSARFAGAAEEILIPPGAVMGIYAKENGLGMLFPDEEVNLGQEPEDEPDPTKPSKRPFLKVVK
ncbi:MAG: ClpXP protease specificity-enhancing factor [Candidatus Thiodiazotropha sp. (ex Lucinoma aequizonata)]|nr:ClpXP protease specificity-enhancing factor [Candidatus Thiodiazotropha sp. (ex Lucinoma aequizonata)]MCU7887381.1 ClpXP protease specificity-enhancing factor [Candidatus Thiodiazotropha sp. (ex Lucinoma aequizonata)]MCU7894135.1 ClpXP protease specificity-enhancing factor [Candidatus Thiodiazotropha sp. (ex Lucinoma aequizonata)]MCU7897590.1 ClpXP protease specificity-enhancing factor [Candidatus Thiodiazotropha sp. (ex Lucinoma aequizonata)]MCU7903009.1 ClpXP protease specificity-enhancing